MAGPALTMKPVGRTLVSVEVAQRLQLTAPAALLQQRSVAVPEAVLGIVFGRTPTKVGQVVVGPARVRIVARLLTIVGRPDKRLQNEPMNSPGHDLVGKTEAHHLIPRGVEVRLQRPRGVRELVGQSGVTALETDRPNRPVITNEVARAVRNRLQRRHVQSPMHTIVHTYTSEVKPLLAAGWREVEWFASGFLRGGMANTAGSDNHQQGRERLWLSTQCLEADQPEPTHVQMNLFGENQ